MIQNYDRAFACAVYLTLLGLFGDSLLLYILFSVYLIFTRPTALARISVRLDMTLGLHA